MIAHIRELRDRGFSLRDIAGRLATEGTKLSHVSVGSVLASAPETPAWRPTAG
jgi:hypothetical protein